MSVHMIPYHRSPPSSDNPRAELWVRRVYVDLIPRVGLVRGLWSSTETMFALFRLIDRMESQPVSLCFAVRLTEEWRSRNSFLRKNCFASTSGEFSVHDSMTLPLSVPKYTSRLKQQKNSSETDITDQ